MFFFSIQTFEVYSKMYDDKMQFSSQIDLTKIFLENRTIN